MIPKKSFLFAFKALAAFAFAAVCGHAQVQKLSPNGVFALLPNDDPDLWTESCWTDPDVAGVVLRSHWNSIEPAKGTFNWQYITDGITLARANGKKLAVGISAGQFTPDWVYQDGAYAFPITNVGPAAPPWDPVMQADWADFISAFATQCDQVPEITYITMGGAGRAEESYWCNGKTDEALLAKLYGSGPGYPLWVGGAKAICDLYFAAFQYTPLCFATGAPVSGNDGHTAMEQVIAYGTTTYPGRFGVKSDGLRANIEFPAPIGSSLFTLSGTAFSGFQMSLPAKDPDKLSAAFASGQAYFPHMNEVYEGDVENSDESAVIQSYNQQLLQPPPVNISATGGANSVALTWAPRPAADTTLYNVKRGTANGGPYTTVGSLVAGTSFTDTGLTNGSTYYYVLTSSDGGTDEGLPSPEVGATAGAVTQVGMPSFSLVDTALYTGSQSVAITSATSGAKIRYSTDGSAVSRTTGTLYAGAVTLTHDTVLNAIAYATGGSTDSAVASASYTIYAAAPTNLVALGGDSQVALSWTGDASDASYTVLRSTTAGGGYTALTTTAGTSFTDTTGLANGTPYYYVVQGTNVDGASGNSNEATATPNPASFTVTVAPSNQSGADGAVLSFTVTVTAINGFTGTVSLGNVQQIVSGSVTLSHWPYSLSASVNLTAAQPVQTVTLQQTIGASAAPGTAVSDTVTGTSGSLSFSAPPVVTSHFTAGATFTLTLDQNVQNGGNSDTVTYTLTVASVNGFAGIVNLTNDLEKARGGLSLDSWPASLSAPYVTLTPSGTQTVTLSQTIGSASPTGTAVADTITGVSGALSVTALPAITTHFSNGQYAVYASPLMQTGAAGSSLSYPVVVAGYNFTSAVALTNVLTAYQGEVDEPNWVNSITPSSVTPVAAPSGSSFGTAILAQTIDPAATPGAGIQDMVTGTSGSAAETALPVTAVNPYPAYFSVAVAPQTQNGTAGQVLNYTVTVAAANGFTGTVNLTNAQQVEMGSVTLANWPASFSSSFVILTAAKPTATVTLMQTIGSGAAHGTEVSDTVTATSASDPGNVATAAKAYASH